MTGWGVAAIAWRAVQIGPSVRTRPTMCCRARSIAGDSPPVDQVIPAVLDAGDVDLAGRGTQCRDGRAVGAEVAEDQALTELDPEAGESVADARFRRQAAER